MHLISELNTNQINSSLISIRNEIRKNSVFEKGSEFSVPPNMNFIVGGLLTGGSTEIKFSIVLPKTIESQSIVVTELKANIRHSGSFSSFIPNSGYVIGGFDWIKNYKVNAYKVTDNIVGILMINKSGFNAKDDYPLAVEINKMTLQFK